MLSFVNTSLLESDAQTVVNTINTVGVMGKGLAKHFKDKYPEMYFEYKDYCDKKLFDIGCGTGYWLDVYVRKGITKENITGVDLAPSNVEDLQKKGFKAVCGNVLNLDLNDNVSDLTMCNGVIHHTNDPFKAFNELVKIKKPGRKIQIGICPGNDFGLKTDLNELRSCFFF